MFLRFLVVGFALTVPPALVWTTGLAGAQARPTSEFIRAPEVAGRFYPADPATLRRAIDAFLRAPAAAGAGDPVAIVAPHAGYIFSGQIAADAFNQVRRRDVDVVVVLGANHTTPGFTRIALFPGAAYRSPLGLVPVDSEIRAALAAADPQAVLDARPHQDEHSIEVLLPFVQIMFPGARIVPIVVAADPDVCARFGRTLAGALEGRRALIVASSDLSHYPPARHAEEADRRTLDAMARLDARALVAGERRAAGAGLPNLSTTACGLLPVLVAVSAARALGATQGRVVSYAHSADVAVGDPDRVVGYGAVSFSRVATASGAGGDGVAGSREPAGDGSPTAGESEASPTESPVRRAARVASESSQRASPLDAGAKRALVALARDSIARYLETETLPLLRDVDASLVSRRQGAFVTLKQNGRLRGCIGRVAHDGPLPHLVSLVAVQAATSDPRFKPVAAREVAGLELEVSLLTPPTPIAHPREIVVGRDGVLLRKDGREAVFLPYVAREEGWTRDRLLDELCVKASLIPRCWVSGASLETFQSEDIRERDVR
jgi:AmmeMemoRadiSam system protein B/AmmeMemoRadiSam system protein A